MTLAGRKQAVDAALIGIALALILLVAMTRTATSSAERDDRENNLLTAFREEEITRVRIEAGDSSFTLVRTEVDDEDDPSWALTEPLAEPADPFAVQDLLGSLGFAAFVRRIQPEEVNRASFGLDAPERVIHVDMGDIKYRLRIGAEAVSPAGSRYVEIAGEGAPGKGVAIVSRTLLEQLARKVEDFRERYVMPYLSTALDRIVLEGEGGARKLRRGAWPDGFRFDGMEGDARIGRAALGRVLTQFGKTRAERFIDVAAAEKGLSGGPVVKITMAPSNPKSPQGVVEVGGACPDAAVAPDAMGAARTESPEVVAIRRAPDAIAACVPRSVLGGLTMPAEALVDRALFWMRSDEVESLEIRQGEARLALERRDTGFVMRAPQEAEVDAEAGNGRVEAILRTAGVIVTAPDAIALGLEPPFGQVTLRSAAAQDDRVEEEIVLLGTPRPDGRVFAKRKHDGVVIEVGREAARALLADSVLVRSRRILDVPLMDVESVELEGPVRQSIDRARSGAMTLRAPAGFEVDGTLGLELFDALRTLTAERWVAEKDDGTFGFDTPSITARLVIEKNDVRTTHVLRLGRPVGSGYYGKLDGDPGVFVVSKRLREILSTWVVDRAALSMDAATTRKIVLLTDTRTVTLEKRGDEFIQTDDGEPLSPESVQRIVDTLSGLSAEAAVSLGPPRPSEGFARPTLTLRLVREAGHVEKADSEVVFRVGAGDSYRGIAVHYARREGVEATYAVAQSAVVALTGAL